MKLVECFTARGGFAAQNNAWRCAERVLISRLVTDARQKGVATAKMGEYLRRKHGPLRVERRLGDGSEGVSLPCVRCRKELDKYGLRWSAIVECDGHLVETTNSEAPPSKSTSGQKTFYGWK